MDTMERLARMQAEEQIISMMREQGFTVTDKNEAFIHRIVHYHYNPKYTIGLIAKQCLAEAVNSYDFCCRLNDRVENIPP